MKKDSSYIEAFQHLGNSWDVTAETMNILEDNVTNEIIVDVGADDL